MSETITSAVRAEIAEKFGDGKTFTVYDFTDVALQFGTKLPSLTHVFRAMVKSKMLVEVGSCKRSAGGSPHKIYKLIVGVSLASRAKSLSYSEEVKRLESHRYECGLRLQQAMENWV